MNLNLANRTRRQVITLIVAFTGFFLFDTIVGEASSPQVAVLTGLVGLMLLASVIVLNLHYYHPGAENPSSDEVEHSSWKLARFLTHGLDTGAIILPVRVFIGLQWLEAGWHKVTSSGWLDGGASLAKYWQGAAAKPALPLDWYRDFLQVLLSIHAQSWFSYLVVFGEIAIGLGLIFGCLTGIAALFGIVMNLNFMLAGSLSSNPILLVLALLLITVGWRVAGLYGVDGLWYLWHHGKLPLLRSVEAREAKR